MDGQSGRGTDISRFGEASILKTVNIHLPNRLLKKNETSKLKNNFNSNIFTLSCLGPILESSRLHFL